MIKAKNGDVTLYGKGNEVAFDFATICLCMIDEFGINEFVRLLEIVHKYNTISKDDIKIYKVDNNKKNKNKGE